MPRTGIRRTAMFSATFGTSVQHLAADFLDAYTFIAVGRVGSAAQTVTQRLLWVEDEKKPDALLGVLLRLAESLGPGEASGAMVFVNTKDAAHELEGRLQDWRFRAFSVHGDKKQQARESALAAFRDHLERSQPGSRGRRGGGGGLAVLVATDVASRGLDIPDIACVVQYDIAAKIDDFVHRSGRTGRLGRTGMAVAFANARQRGLSPQLARTLEEAGAPVPGWLRGMAISTGEVEAEAEPEDAGPAAAYGAQDVRLSGAGVQTAEERAEAQKLRTFTQDAYGE
mmetsp:Transcript_25747/g.77775  ORF Transcript_25747/g.77775 Transcript_25747/m.77775 type:complete len:284 (+) Transcript_25747:2-853(+)